MDDFHTELVAVLPKLRHFAIGLTGSAADADDLLQNAVERALKRRHTFNADYGVASWMYKITQNLWIDEKRKQARRGITVDIDETYDMTGEDGRTATEQRNMTQKVLGAIAALPDGQRLAVTHVLVDGRTYKEAAAILGVPVGTVMSRLSRARSVLEQQVLGASALEGAAK